MVGTVGPGADRRWSNPTAQAIWCTVSAFGTYACMYGFRKPFTAGVYVDDPFSPGFKASLIGAQVLGYTLSKLIGIRVIAEMPPRRRIATLLGLIAVAQAAWVLFGALPPSFAGVCLFLNGLSLGMVFGLVLGFLEGRRLSEAFITGLCCSFILADGISKSVGLRLLEAGVPERWMPAAAGAVFALPLWGFASMLGRVPPPAESDVTARSERLPMDRKDRWGFLRRHGGVVVPIIAAYTLVTLLRSVRADFSRELWQALGAPGAASVFTRSEAWVTLAMILPLGLIVRLADHRRAFYGGLGISCLGLAVVVASSLAWQWHRIGAFGFMVAIGIGLYLPYIAVHATVFERLIALSRERANLGFLMYLADTAGYVGVCAVMAMKGRSLGTTDILPLFLNGAILAATLGIGCLVTAAWALRRSMGAR